MAIVTVVIVTLITLVCLGYTATCAVIAHTMTTARRMNPRRNSTWDKHSGDSIRIASRESNVSLAAWYITAENPVSAVLFVHGKDCCRGEELNSNTYSLATNLVQRGISVLMLDLRGHGESDKGRLTYGLRERQDVLGALDWLMLRGYKSHQIGFFGASMGGACTLAAAVQSQDQGFGLGALVTDSTYADFTDMMRRKFRKLSGMPNIFLPGALLIGTHILKINLSAIKPEQDAARLSGVPMLVIHSEGDQFVPVDHANRLAESGKGALWITQNERHMASFQQNPNTYADRVGEFFAVNLGQATMRLTA